MEWVNQLISQSIDKSMEWVNQLVNEWLSQPINQSINQWVHKGQKPVAKKGNKRYSQKRKLEHQNYNPESMSHNQFNTQLVIPVVIQSMSQMNQWFNQLMSQSVVWVN